MTWSCFRLFFSDFSPSATKLDWFITAAACDEHCTAGVCTIAGVGACDGSCSTGYTNKKPSCCWDEPPFRDVDLTVSIGRIDETKSWDFALILVVTDVMDGQRCSKWKNWRNSTQSWNFALILVVTDVMDGWRCSKTLLSRQYWQMFKAPSERIE